MRRMNNDGIKDKYAGVLNEFIKKATSPDCDLISVSVDTDYASNIQKYNFKIANHEEGK